MEVILKSDIKNLGEKNEIVKVKNGYGLNFLIPKGFAVLATEPAKKMHAENIKQQSYKEGLRATEIRKIADKLQSLSLKISAKMGESGKLFGSITNIQVAEALKKLGHEIDRHMITIEPDHIKTLGSFTAELNLHKDVKVNVPFEVVEEVA